MTGPQTLVPELRFRGFSDEWEQRKVTDIANRFDNLRIPVAANLRIPGSTPYYGANGIQDYVEGFTHEGEFVLVAEDGANDLKNYPVKCVNGRIWVNNHAHVLQSKPEMADNKFLAYSISQADIEALLVGGGRAKLNAEVMMGIDLFVPSVQEQVAIGSYLTQLDNLITFHQRKYDRLKNVKKSMLEKMFPRDGSNVPEIRFAGFTNPWEQRKLSSIVERVTRKNTELESTLPLTISAQYGLVDQVTYFNNRVASQNISNYYLVKKGEFAYNKSSSDGYPFGTVKRLDLYEMGVLSTLYIVFALNDSNVDSDFLACYYDTDNWHKQVSERAAEGARNHGLLNISAEDFLDTELMIPSEKEEQALIGRYLKKLDHLITLHQRKYEMLQKIKNSLLQKMLV